MPPPSDYWSVGQDPGSPFPEGRRDALYQAAIKEFGPALERLANGYEADPERRRDLRQEMHFQLWRSFEHFDGRCSLKTWAFRVAHNTAISYIARERRARANWVSLEEVELPRARPDAEREIDDARSLEQLSRLILALKPLDRQVLLCYLEEMEASAIAEVTGLSPANVAVKIHRIKNVLARQFHQEQPHA